MISIRRKIAECDVEIEAVLRMLKRGVLSFFQLFGESRAAKSRQSAAGNGPTRRRCGGGVVVIACLASRCVRRTVLRVVGHAATGISREMRIKL